MIQNKQISVCEYALLIREGVHKEFHCSSISASAFDWLLAYGHSTGESERNLISVVRYQNTIALRVVNLVGILETPCGTRIEILPKISNSLDSEKSKKILLKMLKTVLNLSIYSFKQTKLEVLKRPLFEILITQFLNELSILIKRGVRSHYQRQNDKSSYLKGRLEISKQIRQRPGQCNFFHVSYEKYITDCPENRLIRSSLGQVLNWTRNNDNKRLGKKLLLFLDEIPCSSNYIDDFAKWIENRSLAHYQKLKPWCKLILRYQTPVSLSGNAKGISFLFPMEQLFERYVAIKLRRQLPAPFLLKEQVSSKYLLRHNEKDIFRLKPDLLITNGKMPICIADTKWKLLDENIKTSAKYNLKQSDLYQMFAYGSKYLNGTGDMYLIYPKHINFPQALGKFSYGNNLNLFVVPFDLDTDTCALVDDLSYK